MKKQILTIVLAITTLTAFAQVPSYVPTNGLVGYWPFNGNAQDESGNLNHGNVNGATLTTDRFGNSNSAYKFITTNKIDVASNSRLQMTQNISISFWVYPFSNGLTILRKGYDYGVDFSDLSGNQSGLYLIFFTPNLFSTNQLPIQTWSHIVVVKNSSNKYVYINGVLNSTTTNTSNFSISNNPLTFGSWNNETIDTKIDDIAFYNRSLTQQEITALYTSCSTPTASITPQSSTTFCQNGSVVLNASTGVGYTYEWYKDANLINGSITSSYTANQSGSYTVKVINGACNATSTATTVTVNPNPTVSLSLANLIYLKAAPVTLAGSPSGGTYSGPGVVGSTFSSTNAGLGKKTITYNYTSGAGCSGSATAITTVYDTTACSTFDTLFINIAVAGLTAPNNLGTLKIWPNPANDHITIDNGNFSILNGYSIKIETVLGQEVFKSVINQQQFSVDLSTWKGKGIYLVHVLDGQNNIIESKKIILQ